MKKGYFITFEGIDGSGKTTQLELAKDFLEEKGYDVIVTREPGALELGQKIRDILLNHKGKVSDRCEMFLFLADRAQHVETLIKPAVESGKIILCDRYTDSTIAYQGYARGQDVELLTKLNNIAIRGLLPDLTLLYDTSVETAQTRVGKEKDRMESSGINFHKKVRQGYLTIQDENPERIKRINADKSIEDVFAQTKEIIVKLLQEKRGV